MDIQGKSALVTGGAVRVGKAISMGLAKAGAEVAVHYNRSKDEAQKTVSEIEALGGKAFAIQGDFRKIPEVERVVSDSAAQTGRLDILINNAANYFRTPIGEVTEDGWDALFHLNVKAPFFCAQFAASFMKKQANGWIINIADVAGISPWHDFIAYSASKAGLISITKGLARALAPDVQVNAIASGTVLIHEEASEKYQRQVVDQTLLKRVGKPEDIVNTVLFLLQGSDYVTGTVVTVDGGRLLA